MAPMAALPERLTHPCSYQLPHAMVLILLITPVVCIVGIIHFLFRVKRP
jgi:hypothetical protein